MKPVHRQEAAHMQQWEYFTTFVWADVNKDKRDFTTMFPT